MIGGGCCSEVIDPTLKLRKMLTLLKLLFFIILFLIILDMFFIRSSSFFDLAIEAIILLLVFSTKHYSHMLLFLIACIICMISLIEYLGIWFQKGFYKNESTFLFCFLVFELVLEFFSVFLSLQLYRQMKFEYKVRIGLADPENRVPRANNENIENMANRQQFIANNGMMGGFGNNNNFGGNNNNDEENNNNNRGFVPFGGQGVAVGGN